LQRQDYFQDNPNQPPPPQPSQTAQDLNPPTLRDDTPSITTKRGRGRPRKTSYTPAHTERVNTPTVSNSDLGGENLASQQNEPNLSEQEMGGMLTRAKMRAMERQGIPPPQFQQLVNFVNKGVFLINRDQDYLTQYGTPKFPPKNKREYYKRRIQFLKKLPVQKRNLLLTGDPLFEFDPVVYAHVFHNLAPQFAEIFQRHFNYFIPNPPPLPPPGFCNPPPPGFHPQPPPPVQVPPENVQLPSSDEEVFQDLPADVAAPQEVPPPPEDHFRTPQGSPPSSPSQRSAEYSSSSSTEDQNIQPEKSKQSKEIENASLLFQRLSTQEFPGGHRLRAKPATEATSSPRITSWPVLETKEVPDQDRRSSLAWVISPPATRRTSTQPPARVQAAKKPEPAPSFQLPRTPPATFGQPAQMVAPRRSLIPPKSATFGSSAASSPPSFASVARGGTPTAQGAAAAPRRPTLADLRPLPFVKVSTLHKPGVQPKIKMIPPWETPPAGYAPCSPHNLTQPLVARTPPQPQPEKKPSKLEQMFKKK